MKFLCLIFTLFLWRTTFSQKDTVQVKKLDQVNVYRNKAAYWQTVENVRKIYPYALHAAALLEKFDEELGLIDSKRKKKKYSKQAHKVLKSDYNYVIRDLYRSEGVLLMKLIYRETGLTATEIIKKYRGKINSELYDQLGKIWDQDLDIKYDPEGADWLTEQVVLEIQNELIEFDDEAKMVTKEEYKENMKQYKINRKISKKLMRKKKRAGSTKSSD